MAAAAVCKAENRVEAVEDVSDVDSGSVGDALRVVADALRPALLAPTARQRLLEVGDRIPLSSGGGIECRVDDPDRADLAVRFFRTELAIDALTRAPLVIANKAGAAVAGLARGWYMDRRLAPSARILWLELDLPDRAAPTPSIFVGPGNPPRGAPVDQPTNDEWATIVDLLCPGQSASVVAKLRSALPDGAWIGYLGMMRGHELRATISGLSAADIPSLLHRITWPGEIVALNPILAMVQAHSPRITLGLDLTKGIGPALGIEVSPINADDWEALLDAAAILTPISQVVHNAVLAWRGLSIANDHWPDRLRDQARSIVRRLNHLKFSLNPLRLKAYLYFGLV
jgi:hypothetical protein